MSHTAERNRIVRLYYVQHTCRKGYCVTLIAPLTGIMLLISNTISKEMKAESAIEYSCKLKQRARKL